jgi:hypothetical protein
MNRKEMGERISIKQAM